MKWPESLTLVRHAESAYNNLKKEQQKDPLYQAFKDEYEKKWDSAETKSLAIEVKEKFTLGFSDYDTPLSPNGPDQAITMASNLRNKIAIPDKIYISPYKRTMQTYEYMKVGWPELVDVPYVEDERIREQEHGLALLYNDWRIFNVLNPEQKALYDLLGPYWYRYPNGESGPDVVNRESDWLSMVIREHAEENVMAVKHHLSILSFRVKSERLGATEFVRLDSEEKPINCGVTIYKGKPDQGKDGRLILDIYNLKLY